MVDFPNTPSSNQVFSDGTARAWAYDGAKWVAAGGVAGSVGLMVASLPGLATVRVPSSIYQVLVERYDASSLIAPARYERVTFDPGVPMSGPDATGAWWRFVEDPATPEMAGALGNNTGNDAPAFSRLLQSGDRVIRARPGAVYKVAQDGTTRHCMHNNGVAFNQMTLDMSGAEIVLNADAGYSSYADYVRISGTWNHFALIGGTYRYSSPPFLYGICTAKGTGSTAADAWFEFVRHPSLAHPAWADVRIIDRFHPVTLKFLRRCAGNTESDVTGVGGKEGPGFPMTLTTGSTYRVDLQNAKPDLAEALAIRATILVGDLVGMQHRRDVCNGIAVQHAAHGSCTMDIADVAVHHAVGRAIRVTGVDGGTLVRCRIMPNNPSDVYSTNPGGFRMQDCRGTWTFYDCWAIACGDDAYMSYGTSQAIVATPTTDVALLPTQLKLRTASILGKPLIGEQVQVRNWAAGAVDESDTWTVTAAGPELPEYVLTMDKPVNPAWTPTGGSIIPPDPDDIDDNGDGTFVGDGTGWVLDTMAAPQIIVRGGRSERNRGSGWVVSCVAEGSLIDLDWAADNARDAVSVGNFYPASLNGRIPREIAVHVGQIQGGTTSAAISLGGYAGNTRDVPASAGFVRDVTVTVESIRDAPHQWCELNGVTNALVSIGGVEGWAQTPNPDKPATYRALSGSNIQNCMFDGGAFSRLSHWDVLFDGTSTGNIVASAALARNWLDNAEFRQIRRGVSVAGSVQANTFDRWLAARSAGAWVVSRQPGLGDAEYCMRVQRTAAGTQTSAILLGQQLPGAYVRQLRGKTILAYCRVRGGADLQITATGLHASVFVGTAFGETWDLTNNTTGGLTGGAAAAVDALPQIVPTTDGAIYDYVTQPFLVPPSAAVIGLRFSWTPPASTAGANDYVEFSPIALVIQGTGYDVGLAPDDAVILTGEATVNPASLTTGTGTSNDVTVTGAVLGDLVEAISFSLDLQGIVLTGYVRAADTVSVRFQNGTGSTIDLGSGTVRVRVRRA